MVDFRSDLLLQIDRRSGAIVRRISTEGARADDVAVGPDGSVWTTGVVSGELGRYADGKFEKVAMVEPGINGIEVSADGTVFFATGGTLYRLRQGSSKVERVLDGLPDINGFGVLPDGRILAPGGGFGGPGKAVLIDPDRKTFRVVVDDLAPVAAGATDPAGVPVLLSNATGQLLRIDVAKGTATEEQTISLGAPFDNLSFADDGTLYLSSFASGTITEVPPEGAPRTLAVGR